METETLVPQQEQITDEIAPILRPWTTPRLQRLNKAADETGKITAYLEKHFTFSTSFGPS